MDGSGGVTGKAGTPWSEADDALLRDSYRRGGFRGAVEAFGGNRTKRAIQDRAQFIGAVSRGRWTDEDRCRLRGHIDRGDDATTIALALGRTEKAVLLQCHRSGLPCPRRAPADERVVAQFADMACRSGDDMNVSALATKQRVPYSAAQHAVLKLTGPRRDAIPWDDGEIELLREYYRSSTLAELVEMLGYIRTPAAIRIKASDLGLTRDRRQAALAARDTRLGLSPDTGVQ